MAGPVDIGIEHADPGALGGQRQGQVGRDGGLADPALAGGHSDHVARAIQRLQPALHRVRGDLRLQIHTDGVDAIETFETGTDPLLEARGRSARRVAEPDVDRDLAVADRDAAHGVGQRRAGVGVVERAQRVEQVVTIRSSHWGLRGSVFAAGYCRRDA